MAESEPRLYTLDQAKVELMRQACAELGHDYQLLTTSNALGQEIDTIVSCSRGCGRRGTVNWNEERT